MKAIIFAAVILVLISCGKPTFNLNWGSSNLNSAYTWGIYSNIGDSSNTIKAEIDADGRTESFSVAALATTFTNLVMADSNVITIYGVNNNNSLQLDLINITTTGTYSFGHTPGNRMEAKTSCAIGGIAYYNDRNTLSGSLTIDTLTAHHIHGLFSVQVASGSKTALIKNGSFSGKF